MKNLICCGMLIVLFVDSCISAIPPTNNAIVKQCVQVGGYCQNHWDCCSNSCLSFSYKCVAGYNPPSLPHAPNAAIEDLPSATFGTLDELLMTMFGGDKTVATPSTTPSSTTSTSPSIIEDRFQCIGIGYACADSSECCSNDCLHYLDVNVCIEKRTPSQPTTTTSTTTTTTSPNAQCLLIGQKCYRHEECCTQRCHGYLHQCVT